MELFDKEFVHFMWDDSLEGKEGFVDDSINTLVTRVNDNIRWTVDKLRVFGLVHSGSINNPFPFSVNNINYRFFYYDPNYECKVAYAQGKTIQIRHTPKNEWVDLREEPKWNNCYEYRVKPEPVFYVYKCSDDTLHISDSCAIDFLFEGTGEECKQYIKEHFCAMCVHQSCEMIMGTQFCKGFKEPRRKRRMTYRELAHWLAEGNGQAWNSYSGRDLTQYAYEHDRDNEPCDTAISIRTWDETEWSEPLIEE